VQGRRINDPNPNGAFQSLQPGDYVHLVYTGDDGKSYDCWYACTPNGETANLGAHEVTEHEDGTITVSPSILISTRQNGQNVELWHGWLRRGVWSVA
jgi:hypothetical protein